MSAVPHADDVRPRAAPDPHIVELSKLMLTRAPALGEALADRLCREIDAYRDGTVVTKGEVRASCEANLTFVFHSLSGHANIDVSPAEAAGTARALAGVPLPAVMTAYRVGFRFMWEETLAAARAARIPTESMLDATARVFLAQDTFTQAMTSAYRQQADRADSRAGGRTVGAGRSAALSADNRQRRASGRQPTCSGCPPLDRTSSSQPSCRRLENWDLPAIENKLATRDIRSAWRLLPDLQVGIVHLREPATPDTLGTLIDVLHQTATTRVGISPPFHELAETSSALRFARLAVTGKPSADSLVTVFDDTPLAVAAVSAPEVMAKIKSSVLGRLNELPAEERTILLDTFQAWLQAGGSANDAAAKVFCHPNTVRHRLRRIEELTNRSLSRPMDIAELCLAFEVEQRLP